MFDYLLQVNERWQVFTNNFTIKHFKKFHFIGILKQTQHKDCNCSPLQIINPGRGQRSDHQKTHGRGGREQYSKSALILMSDHDQN